MLEKLFEHNPQHPRVTHYLIHAYDFAPLPDKGVASARTALCRHRARGAARTSHALAPSMVGLWPQSRTASNHS